MCFSEAEPVYTYESVLQILGTIFIEALIIDKN